MRSWFGAASAVGVIATAAVVVQVLPWESSAGPADFRPFVMAIEDWDSARITPATGPAIGGTSRYRLEYRRRDEWTLILLGDDLGTMTAGQGNACRDGVYGSIAVGGAFRPTSRDPAFCDGVPRWIRPGMACCYSWPKTVATGLITYTSPGERVVFDAATGLPLTYEAGPVGGAVRHRTTYRLEQWLGCPAPCP